MWPSLPEDLELPPALSPFPIEVPLLSTFNSERRRSVYANISSIQQSCVQALSTLLPDDSMFEDGLKEGDRQLARALTELLEVCYELESVRPPTPLPPIISLPTETEPSPHNVDIHTSYAALTQHLSDLQAAAQSRGSTTDLAPPSPEQLHPAINVVREKLAWARVESLSHAVKRLVQDRSGRISNGNGTNGTELNVDPFASTEEPANRKGAEPPSYSQDGHGDLEADQMSLPCYQEPGSPGSTHPLLEKKDENYPSPSSREAITPIPGPREKMMRELDAVTEAIERLYSVAPQLHDQRAEMPSISSRGRSKERAKMKELEEIWDRIERAHGKRKIWEDAQRSEMGDVREETAARVCIALSERFGR